MVVACGAVAAPAGAATLCVSEHRGCFGDLQGAVDAAHDGDAIRIAAGRYRGGVTVDVSVELRGAGARATRIRGGGPVITIGAPFAPDPPTVAISGVTIIGGDTEAGFMPDLERQIAFGGGVLIPPSTDFESGATVIIADSVIAGNRAAPSASAPIGPECPGGPCPLAGGYGGGIYNAGHLTLRRTTVTRNGAGTVAGAPPVASDAAGGGIYSRGPLTLVDTVVSHNQAVTAPPNARFAEGGGVFSERGTLTIDGGSITHNRAVLDSAWPSSVEQGNIAGGVFVDGDSSATILHARIEHNELAASNATGDATAFSGGVHGNGPVVMRDTSVASNHVTATVPPGSSGTASADSGAGNLNVTSTIVRSHLTGNTATAVAGPGSAIAAAGALWAWSDATIDVRGSAISDNRVTATGKGAVTAHGGGVVNVGALALRGTDMSHNEIRATGRTGEARGGGIWNARVPESEDLTPRLTVIDSAITGNTIAAGPQITAEGGGLFTSEPMTLSRTRIRGNRPDQCVGC